MLIDGVEVNDLNLTEWEEVSSYLWSDYNGNLRRIPVSVAKDESGDYYVVAETPEENTTYLAVYRSEEEAKQNAKDYCAEQDEAPSLDDLIAQIRDTGYFKCHDVIPKIIAQATEHSQGYLLLTPDTTWPVWTTNGYLEGEYIALDATFESPVQAAAALLKAIGDSALNGAKK